MAITVWACGNVAAINFEPPLDIAAPVVDRIAGRWGKPAAKIMTPSLAESLNRAASLPHTSLKRR
jgi:hypothetical protein